MGRGTNDGAVAAVSTRSSSSSDNTADLSSLSSPGYSLFARVAAGQTPTHMNPIDDDEIKAAQELESKGLAQTGEEDGGQWVSLTELGVSSWADDGLGLDEDLELDEAFE